MLVGDVTKEPPRGGSWIVRLMEQGATPAMLALLERCLEDDPADRPADAQVLAQELLAIINEAVPPTPEPESPVPDHVAKALAEARRLVKQPAIALMTAGIIGLCISLCVLVIVVASWVDRGHTKGMGDIALPFSVIMVPAAGVAICAGWNMMRLRQFDLCLGGSFAVMATAIGPLLGLPLSIWALTTLRTPGMRAAFKLNEEQERRDSSLAALDRI